MKQPPITRFPDPKTASQSPLRTWHGGGDTEILLYARSLQNAAKALVRKVELERMAKTAWDVCPVVLLYRQALEIQMKLLVGEGSNFLPSPTDPVSLSTTRSLRWLAQIVCKIIRKVGWESEFKCAGVSSLAEFSAIVNEVESFDPVSRAIHSSRSGDPASVSEYFRRFDIVQFAAKLDGLLNLLNVTADGLAATWDMREEATSVGPEFRGRDDFGPTIQ